MGIKEIEWDRSGIIQTASLPFGYTADICPRTDGFYQWSIRRGPALIKGDYTITQDGSELACQAAWEDIVKEALEPIDLYVISTEEGIDSICTSADEAKLRQQEVMACSGCMEGFVIVEEFVVDLDGNVTEVEYEEE
jgi:hypothetical protein